MFKELWRKLGSEFLQTSCGEDHQALLSANDRENALQARALPHITHTGEFHLERLSQLLKNRYGKSFHIPSDRPESDQALKEVIGFAARIQDQDIQRELLLFYLNCSPVIQEYLRAETPLGNGPLMGG
ncbi:hypothetical protein [Marinobacter daepoensis]|uniref:hypothetical protein n=1 Tax=Marinobacter daepoensis TaxID=262077 RepID=UPI0004A4B992|nr:hypothetical protein [Marinobacter daepoensis]